MADWQIISVVVAIILPSLLFLIQFWIRRKALSYDIFSQTPLLNIQEKDKWDIQILLDKKPVQDVHLIEIKIFNSGYQEIRPEDYERPISFNFGGSTQILSAEKSEVNPESLQPSIKIEGTKKALIAQINTTIGVCVHFPMRQEIKKIKNEVNLSLANSRVRSLSLLL